MKAQIKNKEVFEKVNRLSNQYKFKIIELTQDKELTITDLSRLLGLALTRTSDYVAKLEKLGM
jgi:Mn-dependent DtxR family transcriptional regulator